MLFYKKGIIKWCKYVSVIVSQSASQEPSERASSRLGVFGTAPVLVCHPKENRRAFSFSVTPLQAIDGVMPSALCPVS